MHAKVAEEKSSSECVHAKVAEEKFRQPLLTKVPLWGGNETPFGQPHTPEKFQY